MESDHAASRYCRSSHTAISDEQLQDVQRPGNASIRANVVAITALVVFGWTKKDSHTKRFQFARDVVQRLLPNQTQVRSRQGLFSALKQCCDCLLRRIRRVLISRLEHAPCWLLAGKPTFAFDGSKFAVPRFSRNLAFFAAASRKSKGAYGTQADPMKAAMFVRWMAPNGQLLKKRSQLPYDENGYSGIDSAV